MENDDSKNIRYLLVVMSVVLVLFVLVRLPIAFRLLLLVAIAGMIFGLVALVRYFLKARSNKAYLRTEEGMVAARIQYCEQEIEKNYVELEEIKNNIEDLRKKMDRPDISPRNANESMRLIQAFTSEANLREQKIEFFQVCIGKLRRLLHNQELSRAISEKRKKLERLKENHYEDLASLEELKTDLELNSTYLETIETLSLRMLESKDYDQAKGLQKELEEMTRNLEEL